ncbi:unnamed protein product [Arabidopsis halleri]
MAITASMRIFIELKDLLEDPSSNFTAVLEELKNEYCELRERIGRKNVELEILKRKDIKRFVGEVMSGEIIVNNREKADLVQELRQRGYTPFPNKAKPAGPFDAAEEFDDELLILENKVKFIGGVISGEIKAINKKKADLVQESRQRGFTPFPNNAKGVEGAVSGEADYGYKNHVSRESRAVLMSLLTWNCRNLISTMLIHLKKRVKQHRSRRSKQTISLDDEMMIMIR